MQQLVYDLWDFLVIKNFSGLATILTIGGAIYLYLKARREGKQQIATLLVNDIRNANVAINTIRDAFNDNPKTIPEVTVLPENNWKKFSFIFSKDFDEDEMGQLNKYFNNVERINYIVTQHSNLFLMHVSTRMAALQSVNMNLLSSANTANEVKEAIRKLDDKFAIPDTNSHYEPAGFYTNLERYLADVPSILMTTAGKKLKQIANPPKSKFRPWSYLL